MMYYAYSIAYRDFEGFVQPVQLDSEKPAIFFKKEVADKVFDYIKKEYKQALRMGRMKMVVTPRKFWFDKVEMKHIKLDEETEKLYRRILETGRVIRVQVAGLL
ncbi:hypothetical protein ESCO47_00143 [Escherichia phage vB_EcoM_ESCO47]|nr:hypothetical protein ESCO47_00143 [Escherichia phage vB_EcoM_ESCO47]